jgi:hypothetical protein
VILPDFSTILVQPGQSVDVTVTNQNYDPIDPFFGVPAPPVNWKIIGTAATISTGTGVKATITTTSAFSSCSVEVSITVGATTKAIRKLVSTQPAVGTAMLSKQFPRVRSAVKVSCLAGGALNISLPGDVVRTIDIFNANGKRVFAAASERESMTIPAGTLTPGMHFFRLQARDGGSVCLRRMVH